jgi:phosphoribosylanthranilate isomerase
MQQVALYPSARGVLLDAYRPGVPGGTGEVFDWALIPAALAPQVILAGGLNADNVAEAIRQVTPYAVDVSGGVEAAPGRKDRARINAFMAAVQQP